MAQTPGSAEGHSSHCRIPKQTARRDPVQSAYPSPAERHPPSVPPLETAQHPLPSRNRTSHPPSLSHLSSPAATNRSAQPWRSRPIANNSAHPRRSLQTRESSGDVPRTILPQSKRYRHSPHTAAGYSPGSTESTLHPTTRQTHISLGPHPQPGPQRSAAERTTPAPQQTARHQSKVATANLPPDAQTALARGPPVLPQSCSHRLLQIHPPRRSLFRTGSHHTAHPATRTQPSHVHPPARPPSSSRPPLH